MPRKSLIGTTEGLRRCRVSPPEVLRRGPYSLAAKVGGRTPGHTDSKMQAVFRTAREHQAGKRVEWDGVKPSARYRFRSQTGSDWLDVTPEEERELGVVTSDNERRRDRPWGWAGA